MSVIFKTFKIVLQIKLEIREKEIGNKISLKGFNLAPLTLHKRRTFKKQVKKFEKYIMPIKPLIPLMGKRQRIKIILKVESEIAVRKVKVCWSRPFKIPSETLSRYIKGIMGERATSRKPTSADL